MIDKLPRCQVIDKKRPACFSASSQEEAKPKRRPSIPSNHQGIPVLPHHHQMLDMLREDGARVHVLMHEKGLRNNV